MCGVVPHYSIVVAERLAAAVLYASTVELHPLALKRMKAYKVTLPRRKALMVDHFLEANGLTLGALVEAALDRWDANDEATVERLAETTKDARKIDARRRSRGG